MKDVDLMERRLRDTMTRDERLVSIVESLSEYVESIAYRPLKGGQQVNYTHVPIPPSTAKELRGYVKALKDTLAVVPQPEI